MSRSKDRTSYLGHAGVFEEADEDPVRVEVLLGKGARSLAVRVVRTLDPARALDRVVERAEAHDPLAGRLAAAPAGVLDEHRLARRQVPDRPVAEPPARGVDVDALRHRELSARLLHVA